MESVAVQGGEFLMDIRRPDQIWLRKGRSLIHISSSRREDRDVLKFTLQKCLAKVHDRDGTSHEKATRVMTVGSTLTDEEKAQEALFELAKTMCNESHTFRKG